MAIAFGLLEMSIVFSLLGFAVPQILVGSFTGLWAGFICGDILRRSAEMKYSNVNLGFCIYMFILSGVLFVASGIFFLGTANKQKVSGTDDRKPALFRKLEVLCSIILGLSMVIFSVLEVVRH